VQDADDQHGFDGLAPDDEGGVTHESRSLNSDPALGQM
jgi:hypothetical protein